MLVVISLHLPIRLNFLHHLETLQKRCINPPETEAEGDMSMRGKADAAIVQSTHSVQPCPFIRSKNDFPGCL